MAKQRDFVGEVPGNAATTVMIPVENLGPPGLSQTLHVVDVTKDGEPPSPKGRRPFKVWAAITAQEPLASGDITMSPTGGDTHLDFGCHDFGVTGGHPDRTIKLHFFSNQYGRIGCVQSVVEAANWAEAQAAFRGAVSPLLSVWSWEHGVPLVLSAVGGRDDAAATSHQVYVRPLAVVTAKPAVGKGWGGSPAFLAAFSHFREGISSTSAPYRLLCFYKLFLTLEHIRRDFEKRSVGAQLTTHKDFYTSIDVKVVANDLAAAVWPDAVGWRLGKLATDKVRDLRNRVGHELFEDEQPEGDPADKPTVFNNFDDPQKWDSTRDAADALLPLLQKYAVKLDALHRLVIGPAEAKSRRAPSPG